MEEKNQYLMFFDVHSITYAESCNVFIGQFHDRLRIEILGSFQPVRQILISIMVPFIEHLPFKLSNVVLFSLVVMAYTDA